MCIYCLPFYHTLSKITAIEIARRHMTYEYDKKNGRLDGGII